MNKLNKILIVIILFVCLHCKVFSNYFITVDNVRKPINSLKINETVFVDYEQLFKIFVPEIQSNQNNFLLVFADFTVIANPQNFFILLESDANQNILQLATPPIIRDKKLFIPVQSFFNSLNYFLDFNFDFTRNGTFIETNDDFWNFFEPKSFRYFFAEEIFLNDKQTVIVSDSVAIPFNLQEIRLAMTVTNENENFDVEEFWIDADFLEDFFNETVFEEIESVSETVDDFLENNSDNIEEIEIIKEQTIIKKTDLSLLQTTVNKDVIENETIITVSEVFEEQKIEEIFLDKTLEITQIIQTKIARTQIANLGFENEMLGNIFLQNTQSEKSNIFKKSDIHFEEIDADNLTIINQSLPPFRKYSIPAKLKKQNLEELPNE